MKEKEMSNTKILVVDDEASVLKIIEDTLQQYDLTTETSPLKAVEIIQKEQFDIFIVDYQMPQINGIELLEEIKSVNSGRIYISIFCTAYGTIHLFKTELVEGLFDFFLEKPYEIDVMRETIQKALLSLQRIRSVEEQQVKNP